MQTHQKMEIISRYSACQIVDCRCTGLKCNTNIREVETNQSKFSEVCCNTNCSHSMETHISHLSDMSEEEMNKILGTIIDIENLRISVARVDEDRRKVYSYLYRLLRQCVLTRVNPVISGPLGDPPFETPSISKAITNFVYQKFVLGQNRFFDNLNNFFMFM